jgi:uncharacterized protein
LENAMSTKAFTVQSKLTGPWLYFALVYLFSWAFTIPVALSGLNLLESPRLMVVYALGGLGPAVTAILLVYHTQDREGRRDYWRRIIDYKRIPLRWYGVIFLLVPAITGLAALLDWRLGGSGLNAEPAVRLMGQPWLILPFIVFYLFFGPIPEEIGWRGYALDQLQDRMSALTASLILGVAWAVWHLPQFFIRGTYQYGLGSGAWLFLAAIVVNAIFYTWIYNNSAHSTLSAILFHFMQNFTGELFDLSARAELYALGLAIVVALLVLILWGPRTLTRPPKAVQA